MKSTTQTQLEAEAKHRVDKHFAKSKTYLKIINVMTRWYNEVFEFERAGSYKEVTYLLN